MPRVSVCIPAISQVECLRRTLQSILIQDFQDYEIVVTDDSQDDSVERLILSMDFNGRMRFFKNAARLGSPENWNEAVRQAAGDYIKIMHHDDYFSFSYSLGRFVQALDERSDADFAFSASRNENVLTGERHDYCIDRKTVIELESEPAANLFGENVIGSPSATIYRRDVSLGYDHKMKWLVDLDFYIRVLERNPRLVYSPEALVTVSTNAAHQVTAECLNNGYVELVEYMRLFAKMSAEVLTHPKVEARWIKLFDQYDIDHPKDLTRYGVQEGVSADYFALLLRWRRRERIFLKFGPKPWIELPAFRKGEAWPIRYVRRMLYLAACLIYIRLPEPVKLFWRRAKSWTSLAACLS